MDVPRVAVDLSESLGRLPGVIAVVLGGSRARGAAPADADVDLGVYYDARAPFDPARLSAMCREVDDAGAAEATPFGGWGPWVDGGAWLTVGGQRVDFIYREINRVATSVNDALAGRVALHAQTGHPHGIHAHHYAAELATCVPLHDPSGRVRALRERLGPYPDALRANLERAYAWQASFWLDLAEKGARRGDASYAHGCAFQAVTALVQVVCARGGAWLTNEKGAVALAASAPGAPPRFAERVNAAMTELDLSALRALSVEVAG